MPFIVLKSQRGILMSKKTVDTREIYEKIILEFCFNRLKTLRNGWNRSSDEKIGLDSIINISGENYRSYNDIMELSDSIILEMIPNLVLELMKAYGIESKWYSIRENLAKVFSITEDENWPDYVKLSDSKPVFAFSCRNIKSQGVLFIFKKYGIENRLPKSLIDNILQENKLDGYFYVSIVEDDAYQEVLNHNNNEQDSTRGTGLLSLRQFFNNFFDNNEYNIFKEYVTELSLKVKNYYGLGIVRTLTPNSLHNYRKYVEANLLNFDINQVDKLHGLSNNQLELLSGHFFDKKNYEVLMGTSDFAQSFMTAEWLFSSLKGAGNIDLTSIAMGYFKSVEQFLFSYIKLHVNEKDGAGRQIYTGSRPLAALTESLLSDEKKVNKINLGSLVSFFGNIDKNGNLHSRNKDLLNSDLNDDTYNYIVKVLSTIVGLRNGYFHKHNLNDWEVVIQSRNNALLIFYLLLGGYRITDEERLELGWLQTVDHSDYYKLCEYMNNKKFELNTFSIPIVYLNGTTEPYDFWFIDGDDYIEFDTYGDAIFSGIYLRRASNTAEKWKRVKVTEENLPTEIWEGDLKISRSSSPQIKPSGPMKKIYNNGKFCHTYIEND